MTIKKAVKMHPDEFIVLTPLQRDIETKRVLTIKILVSCYSLDEAIAAERQYLEDGVGDVCILPTYEEPLRFPPEEAARLFRVLYGMTEASVAGAFQMVLMPNMLGGD